MITTPFTGSAGQLAHQLSTATRRPVALSMFHNAGTRRCRDETGAFPFSVVVTKPLIPWTSGRTPVAMVVQIMGDAM